MSESLDITGRVQESFKGWLTTVPLTWAPRLLTGYQRQSAGEALAMMEGAGEVDTVIIECTDATPVVVNSPVYLARVSLRIRHDCDRVSEANHRLRVSELAARVSDYKTIRDELNAQPDFTAAQIQINSQNQTSSGRSFETTLSVTLECCGTTLT
jgi:hypothetical protein